MKFASSLLLVAGLFTSDTFARKKLVEDQTDLSLMSALMDTGDEFCIF